MTGPRTRKLVVRHPQPSARARLFCFPYAGGGASIFRNWHGRFGPVETVAVELPGRGCRFIELPNASLKSLVQELERDIEPYLDRPFVFFGHSNGALIAFELARSLQRKGISGLRHMIVSAKSAPQLLDSSSSHTLPQAEFIEELRRCKGTPREILENPELMELVLPALRADFAISGTYEYLPGPTLRCGATLFSGMNDDELPLRKVMAWREQFAGHLGKVCFRGDHFFIHSDESSVINAISALLHRVV